ncbi:hypothetical protein AX774_g6945 [Zancudomyces culisetae]|uniref:Uncharacterized protein n=1 Tax=Zancudomyces culisetae TaxID=1213189 RepID=A0A1R1PFK6_ZANCU|nr:hypothetical protein AX774_g6945 [Zancudomyces culisetae]|eukprot:OMH79642.1 hypothetical protein AX774_g6945 [Zancudomyces culisetae]
MVNSNQKQFGANRKRIRSYRSRNDEADERAAIGADIWKATAGTAAWNDDRIRGCVDRGVYAVVDRGVGDSRCGRWGVGDASRPDQHGAGGAGGAARLHQAECCVFGRTVAAVAAAYELFQGRGRNQVVGTFEIVGNTGQPTASKCEVGEWRGGYSGNGGDSEYILFIADECVHVDSSAGSGGYYDGDAVDAAEG